MADALGIGYLAGLTGFVAFGAVVPVVPTGAAVSVAAALSDNHPLVFLVVVAFGALGAYAGDIATYALLRFAGGSVQRRLPWLSRGHSAEALAKIRAEVDEHELPVLLTSRLIPGGRVPVLLAVALGGYPWHRFAVADIGAASLWSLFYAAIGVGGRAVFPEPWQAALAAIGVVLLVSLGSSAWSRRRAATGAQPAGHPDERSQPDQPDQAIHQRFTGPS